MKRFAIAGVVLAIACRSRPAHARSAIATCVKEGLCAMSIDGTSTWVPRVPSFALKNPIEGLQRPALRRSGSLFFPVGFALDLRLDTPKVFAPLVGFSLAFAPGTAVAIHLGDRGRLEAGDLWYTALLLPGVGVHFGGKRFRLSTSARFVYSVFSTSVTVITEKARAENDVRAPHGFGAMIGVEACADVIAKNRGVCGFVEATQAYSDGLQHAVTTGLRLVF